MFDHILVPLDGSALAECVLPHAVALARAFESRLTLLQVLEHPSSSSQTRPVDAVDWHFGKAEARRYLDEITTRLRETGLRTENTLLEGQAAERIIEFARDQDANLIVLSSHGRSGLSGWNVSSVVQKIILRACIPIMIVRAYQPETRNLTGLRYRRLLVPLDCSQRAECVLPFAVTLARHSESQLLLTHLVCRPPMVRRVPPVQEDVELVDQIVERNRLAAVKYIEELRSRLPLDTETRLLVSDNVAGALHELVEQESVDLVVLSAHGYSGGTKWPYGTVAISFISFGATPLLVIQDLAPDEVKRTPAEMAAKEYKGH